MLSYLKKEEETRLRATFGRQEKRSKNVIIYFSKVQELNYKRQQLNHHVYIIKFNFLFFCFQGYSCLDLLNIGMKQSGVYYLQIRGTSYWYLKVYCEQETADGGWTVSISTFSHGNDNNTPRKNWYFKTNNTYDDDNHATRQLKNFAIN